MPPAMMRSPGLQFDIAVTKPDAQPPGHHQEEFVLSVYVPVEGAAQLHNLHLKVVDVAGDQRAAKRRNLGESARPDSPC